MLQLSLSRAVLIFLSTTLAVLGVACSKNKQTNADLNSQQPAPTDINAASPPTKTFAGTVNPDSQPQLSPENELSSFDQALDKASGALSISQSAQSPDDWQLVATQFQDAIALMKKVQNQSPYFAIAQTKITEYERQIKYVKDKASLGRQALPEPEPQKIIMVVPPEKEVPKITLPSVRPKLIACSSVGESGNSGCEKSLSPPATIVKPVVKEKPSVIAPVLPPPELFDRQVNQQVNQQQVFTAPIKRRVGGTPIIEVTFNGRQRFEMIVDTGASGTVITQEMANALGVVTVGKAKANTVSSKSVEFPIGYIDSMEVSGVMVNKVAVAIAGWELETGLLGHDFFGNYDLTIKRDVVEFRPHSDSDINSPETGLTVPTVPTSSKQRRFVEFP
ncbi:MAG: TIGR02281 family clan AA aspartic protease [Heteroscytonema crispum UTEX LB 1556]